MSKVFSLKMWSAKHPHWPVRHGFTPASDEDETINTLRVGPLVIGWELFDSE